MQALYEARDALEAQMLVDYLETSHINANVQGAFLNGAAGDLAATSFLTVWIMQDEDLAIAKKHLQHFLSPNKGSDWVCTHCESEIEGEFSMCWQCGETRSI